MTEPLLDRDSGAALTCFPPGGLAAQNLGMFFNQGGLASYFNAANEMLTDNLEVFNSISEFTAIWGLAGNIRQGYRSGSVATYKLLSIQAGLNRAQMPYVEEEVAETYLVDMAQYEENTSQYLQKRQYELQKEDPNFLQIRSFFALEASKEILDPEEVQNARYGYVLGSCVVYDIIKKQVHKDELERQFKAA